MRLFIQWGRFALAGLLSLTILMQIVNVNMAAYYENSPKDGFLWQAHNTDYLLMKAGEVLDKNPDKSIKLMEHAVLNKPVEAKFYLLLAHLFELKGKPSDDLIEMTSALNPYMPINQIDIANYWIRKGDGEKTLKHWGLAIEANQSLKSQYFPLMLELGETGLFNHSFNEMAKLNPSWWLSFFNFTLARVNDEAFPRQLYKYRQKSSFLTQEERSAYIDYLLFRRFRVIEAYATWIVGLDDEYKTAFGYLFDGDFNLPPSGDGFGWRYFKATGYDVTRISERDNTDSPSLKISFYGSKIRQNSLVTQHLMLSPGRYELSGKYRSEDLNAGEGVRWRLICHNQKNVAFSSLVKGHVFWSNFKLKINIPDAVNCNAQTLILESVPGGDRPFDYNGSVWFDQLRIRKQN